MNMYPSIHPPNYLSIYLLIFIYLPKYLSISIYLSINPLTHPPIYLPTNQPTHQLTNLSIYKSICRSPSLLPSPPSFNLVSPFSASSMRGARTLLYISACSMTTPLISGAVVDEAGALTDSPILEK